MPPAASSRTTRCSDPLTTWWRQRPRSTGWSSAAPDSPRSRRGSSPNCRSSALTWTRRRPSPGMPPRFPRWPKTIAASSRPTSASSPMHEAGGSAIRAGDGACPGMPASEVIDSARGGQSAYDIVPFEKSLYLIVSEPAMFADEVLGTITTGYKLDDRVAEELSRVTHCEVNLVCARRSAVRQQPSVRPTRGPGGGAACRSCAARRARVSPRAAQHRPRTLRQRRLPAAAGPRRRGARAAEVLGSHPAGARSDAALASVGGHCDARPWRSPAVWSRAGGSRGRCARLPKPPTTSPPGTGREQVPVDTEHCRSADDGDGVQRHDVHAEPLAQRSDDPRGTASGRVRTVPCRHGVGQRRDRLRGRRGAHRLLEPPRAGSVRIRRAGRARAAAVHDDRRSRMPKSGATSPRTSDQMAGRTIEIAGRRRDGSRSPSRSLVVHLEVRPGRVLHRRHPRHHRSPAG